MMIGDQKTCSVYVPEEFGDFLLHYPRRGTRRYSKTENKHYVLTILRIEGRTRYET